MIAIVILVTAVVLLGIFSQGVSNADQIANVEAQCRQTGYASCATLQQLPPTWSTQKLKYGNDMQTCQQITGISECSGFGVETGKNGNGGASATAGSTDASASGSASVGGSGNP